ncbi:MAG: TlpA disulfide reductase family protein [Pseudomonadota bacterium]
MKELLTVAALVVFVGLGWLLFAPPVLRTSPDISLLGIDGGKLHLADYRGRPLLVTFWATSCPGCIREMPRLAALYRELAPRGLEIIGIAMHYDPPNEVLAMRERRRIPYPIALDITAAAAHAFGDVQMTPTTFLIAPDGRIVFHAAGELDPDMLRARINGLLPQATTATRCDDKRGDPASCSG